MSFKDEESFGVTIVMPDCAFAAELERKSISDMLNEIDQQLDEEGAPVEAERRREMMLDNALAVSSMVANQEIEHADGVADIALSFIYLLVKGVSFDNVNHIRGLTGTFLRNRLAINPCLDTDEYLEATQRLQTCMEDEDFDWAYLPSPTVH